MKPTAAGRLRVAFEAQRPQRVAHQLARLDHLRPRDTRTGIEVEDDAVGFLDVFGA